MGKKIEGYWDCPYCDKKANLGRYRNCPGCGRPRGSSTKFYLIEKDKFVDDSVVPKGPDWFCECCESYNTFSADYCTSCGAPKGASKDYFDIRREKGDTVGAATSRPSKDNAHTSVAETYHPSRYEAQSYNKSPNNSSSS